MSNTVQGPQKLPSVAARDYRYAVIFTILLAVTSISGTLWYDVPLTFDDSSPSFLLPFFFGPVTLIPGFFAIRGFFRQRKIGTPVLEYSPARLGGTFAGTIVFDKPADVLGDFTLKLNCFAYGARGYDGERSPLSTRAFWSGRMIVAHSEAQSAGRINFTMKLPSAPQLPPKGRETYWQMDVTAPMRGVNFFARFSALRFY